MILIIAATLLLLSFLIILFLNKKNNQLLYKILPKKIAHKVGNKHQKIAEHHYDVAVIFIDMVGFSNYSKGKQPEQIVDLLNNVFKKMDSVAKL